VIVSVVGIYLAADPELYLRGAARLVPVGRRAQTRDLLDQPTPTDGDATPSASKAAAD
jgi:hypothetical protein